MIFIKFILWFLLSEAIIISIRFLLRNKELKLGAHIGITIGEFLLAIFMAFMPMAGPMALRAIHPFMMAMYVALMMDSVAKAITLIANKYGKKQRSWLFLTAISCVLGIIFLTYGMVNMQIVSPKYNSYSSEKLHNEYKIAFVCDVHIGSSQQVSTTIKTINKLKEENPDFTFLGGDIVDEYTKKEDMQEALSAFKDFSTPVYFIYGNHDPYGKFTQEDFVNTLHENNIIIVRDEYVALADDLTLLGREDASIEDRKPIEDLVNPYPNTYVLMVDHQPTTFEDNCKAGIDLQLSGHIHAGQLFPLLEFYSIIAQTYGEYHNGNATLYVSAGASGWRTPLRTSRKCRYEIISLTPAN